MIYICPDVHNRPFYKPVLQIKDKPIVFLGDYMDPYWWEGFSDEEGIENLKEIFNFARNNKNVILLAGNHCCNFIWSPMSWVRTNMEFYKELHKLYRDNIDLLHPIYKIEDVIFTHAGISSGWVNTTNNMFKRKGIDFQLTEDSILSYINNEWNLELKNDKCPNRHFGSYSLNSYIFDIGQSRGGDALYGGPFWNDFKYDYSHHPEGFNFFQIVGHTQRKNTGCVSIKDGLACVDSRAIFEYYPETHLIVPSKLNNEEVKSEISEKDWGGKIIEYCEDTKESV